MCKDDSLNVTVPMRMLEIFSSEKTYLPIIPDANYVASLLEQILHYMVQTGRSSINRSALIEGFECSIDRCCVCSALWRVKKKSVRAYFSII